MVKLVVTSQKVGDKLQHSIFLQQVFQENAS